MAKDWELDKQQSYTWLSPVPTGSHLFFDQYFTKNQSHGSIAGKGLSSNRSHKEEPSPKVDPIQVSQQSN